MEDSPKVLSYVKKFRLTIRSGRGLPEGVHWATELYFWRTLQTRLDFLEVSSFEEVDDDSRELRGRIRMATIIPSSVVGGDVVDCVVSLLMMLLASLTELEGVSLSLVDMLFFFKR